MTFETFCRRAIYESIFKIGGQVRIYINKETVPRIWMGLGSFFSLGLDWKYKDYKIKEMVIHFKKDCIIYVFKLRG